MGGTDFSTPRERMFRATPTTVTQGDCSPNILSVCPTGSTPGQRCFAIASLMIATGGASSRSSSVNARPRRIWTPSVLKNPGVTCWGSALGEEAMSFTTTPSSRMDHVPPPPTTGVHPIVPALTTLGSARTRSSICCTIAIALASA